MKKKILLLMGIFSLGLLNAQVGINTLTPATGSVLHIDGAGDNVSATIAQITASQASNDVLIDANGNMGIGTVSPLSKLHIVRTPTTPMIRLVDGTEGEGKILTADVDGVATWNTGVRTEYIDGADLVGLSPPYSVNAAYTNHSITLPTVGWWIVRYNLTWYGAWSGITAPGTTSDRGTYIRLFLSTSNVTAAPIQGSTTTTVIVYPSIFSSTQCSVVFQATANQTLYLWAHYEGIQMNSILSYNPSGRANILDAFKW